MQSLKKQYGEQVMSFPQISYGIQGGFYTIDFLVDQRKCDIFSLLVLASSQLESEENKKRNSMARPFEGLRTTRSGNNMTYVLEFSEQGKNKVSKKGTITFMGEFRADRPSFRFCLSKEDEISETDISILKAIFETANKNTLFSEEKMKNVQNSSINQRRDQKTQSTAEGAPSLIKKALGIEGDEDEKLKNETIEKLNEMGVSIFAPDDKKNM